MGRPKNIILLVSSSEFRMSLRTFLFETKGYAVVKATTASEALELIEASPVDCPGAIDVVVAELELGSSRKRDPAVDGNQLALLVRRIRPDIRTLLISVESACFANDSHADVFLTKDNAVPAEVMERLRALVVRKRGPKKSSQPIAAASIDAREIA
jgi:two-component system response regulator CpxR